MVSSSNHAVSAVSAVKHFFTGSSAGRGPRQEREGFSRAECVGLEVAMKIVIAGGSGFLGRPLAAALTGDGHDVVALTRRTAAGPGSPRSRSVAWTPNGDTGAWAAEIDGAGAVVNLAGESIA